VPSAVLRRVCEVGNYDVCALMAEYAAQLYLKSLMYMSHQLGKDLEVGM